MPQDFNRQQTYDLSYHKSNHNLQHSFSDQPEYSNFRQYSFNEDLKSDPYYNKSVSQNTTYNKRFIDPPVSNSRQLYSNELKKHPKSQSFINYYNENSTQYYSADEPMVPSREFSGHKSGIPDKFATAYESCF